MRAKTVTLYSLPCVVAIASLLVAAHEIAPLARSVGVSAADGHHAGQTVNRACERRPAADPPRFSESFAKGANRPFTGPETGRHC